MKALIAVAALCLSGCCIAPNTVGPELGHTSHLTQHQPFTNHPTSIGFDSIGIAAHWREMGAYLDVSEAYNFSSYEGTTCAGMCGGREVFAARVGYEFQVRP